MTEKLTKLYNTLLLVETKGESTKILADCLRYTERMIQDEKSKEQELAKVPVEESK